MIKTILGLLLGFLIFGNQTIVSAQDAKRSITQISGDLYRFQNNFHFSVFLVTPEGVIVSDPINAEAATWLSNEIKSRFGVPIKYAFYSHHHTDHISGGEVFANAGATIIAHENAVAGIKADQVPTALPDQTFSDRLTLSLGGKTVQLLYLGRNHSDNSIVALFPDERTLFAVDFITAKRLPYQTIGRAYFPDYFDTLDKVAEIDFDIFAGGHGPMGDKQDALDHAQYLRELHAAVKQGKSTGKTMEELQESITMEKYKNWGQYEQWLKLNIQGMYGYIN